MTGKEKKGFWYTPLPLYVLTPFKFIIENLFGGKKIPPFTDKILRIILICFGIVSLPVIWIMEGVGNPLELFVDIPFFSLAEYPNEYSAYYFVFIPFFTMLLMMILNHGICRGKEYKFFSVNGILVWVISLALGIVADSFTRNIFLEKYFITFYERTKNASIEQYQDKWILVLLLILTLFAFYYVLDDSMSSSLSIFITPYLMIGYHKYVPTVGILQNVLVEYLIITFVLKWIVTLADKAGLIEIVTKFIGKYFYTPRYFVKTYLLLILMPLWPILIIVYLVRHNKKKS